MSEAWGVEDPGGTGAPLTTGGGPVTLLAACVGAPSGALLRNKERRSAPAGALCARVELAKPLTGW